jgi:methylenetetrahydrofolate dehydrogenase (NADP+) / methenyltetrahydrofolate cyclohydrolase
MKGMITVETSKIILDGGIVADTIKADLIERIAKLLERGITPCLATILVGDDPASDT